MNTVCKENMCTGCTACESVCKKSAITICDEMDKCNAVIDMTKCIHCGACERVCQVNHLNVQLNNPIEWYQGWANDPTIRSKASSGGAASALMRSFIKNGGIVCSCTYKDGKFGFDFCKDITEVDKFSGSKYIKSNLLGILEPAKKLLIQGERLLFVGLPCQVAALKNYVGDQLFQNLYTVDLICHGTPSTKVMDVFLSQYNKKTEEQSSFKFRDKDLFQVSLSENYVVQKGAADRYTIAFLNALSYTENCYSCRYACLQRVSDVTLGDSWGSELPVVEQKKGISLILVQTEKGRNLLGQADLILHKVNLERAIDSNQQLLQPSPINKYSKSFWKALKKGKKFNKLVFCFFPYKCFKQDIKRVLLALKLIHR